MIGMILKKKTDHFIHLLSKFDENRHICRTENAAVLMISESQLGNLVLLLRVNIDSYNQLASCHIKDQFYTSNKML